VLMTVLGCKRSTSFNTHNNLQLLRNVAIKSALNSQQSHRVLGVTRSLVAMVPFSSTDGTPTIVDA